MACKLLSTKGNGNDQSEILRFKIQPKMWCLEKFITLNTKLRFAVSEHFLLVQERR